MIKGLGCDIVCVSRLDKGTQFLTHFMERNLTQNEIDELKERNIIKNEDRLKLSLATRYAAKEAVSKAFGTGFRDGLSLRDIEILHNDLGAPYVVLYKNALDFAAKLTDNAPYKIHLSLSNEQSYAYAVAIIEVEK